MEEKLKIVQAYINDEFKKERSEYDISIPDIKFDALQAKMLDYFHTVYRSSPSRKMTVTEMEEEGDFEFYDDKKGWIVKREIITAEEYSNPKLGDALNRVVKNQTLLVINVGPNENPSDPFKKNRRLYWAETDEGFKIIYQKLFIDNVWKHEHDHGPMQVKEDGKLIQNLNIKSNEQE